MRNHLCALAALAAVACGPSSKEVAGAKTAHYKGDKLQLFATTKSVVESKYTLTKSDETSLGMQTAPRWYSPEGLVASERNSERNQAGTGNNSMYPDNSIKITLVVTLLPDGDAWVVKVTPLMERFHAGSPKTEPLKENDASVPGWATSLVDQLALDIHKALEKFEVKTVPAMVPANTNAPPPDEPSAQGSAAQGSAAPAAKP